MNYTVGDLLKEQGAALKLDLVAGGAALGRRILGADLNRPGLALSGFLENFRPERIQIIGVGEQAYCLKAPAKPLAEALSAMLAFPELPCLIVSQCRKAPAASAPGRSPDKIRLVHCGNVGGGRGGEECSRCAKRNSVGRVLSLADKKCPIAHQGVARTGGRI